MRHWGMHWFEPDGSGGIRPRGVVWAFDIPHKSTKAVHDALERSGLLLTTRFERGPVRWWNGNAVITPPFLFPVTVIWHQRGDNSSMTLVIWGPPGGDDGEAEHVVEVVAHVATAVGALPEQHMPGNVDTLDDELQAAVIARARNLTPVLAE